MKRSIVFLFVFISSSIYSQVVIKGNIKNKNGKILESANIQVINPLSNKTINFVTSNNQGNYFIEVKKLKAYLIKVSYLGYLPSVKKINYTNQKGIIINFMLNPSENKLNEVVLNADVPAIIMKKDTVIYNVGKFMNGTEENLKDIIKKLPNLDIDENGKILNNGKKIDKLLINGTSFFGDQHQLATNNIASEMVKNIQLIRNYKGNFNINNDKKSGIVALNVNLKKQYKNKIVGNTNAGLGYKNKYSMHFSSFSFKKKLKLALISDLNNTGKKSITLQDYLSFRGGIKIFLNNNESVGVKSFNMEDIPSFLTKDNNVKDNASKFSALNMIFTPNNKFRITVFSIINKSNQHLSQDITRNYFSAIIPFKSFENIKGSNDYFLETSVAKFIYKINNNSILKYITNANFLNNDKSNQINNISNSAINKELNKNRTFVYGQELKYSKRINPFHFISINFFQDYSFKKSKYLTSSNFPFLNLEFSNNNYSVFQQKRIKKHTIGFETNYNIKFKQHRQLNLDLGANYSNHDFNANVKNYNDFYNKISLLKDDHYLGMNFKFKPRGIIQLSLGVNYHYIHLKYNSILTKRFNLIYKKANLLFRFGLNHNLSLSYNFSDTFIPIDNLLENKLIKDYRTIYTESNLSFNSLLPMHRFGLNYFLYNLPSRILVAFSASYSNQAKSIAENILFSNNNLSEIQFKLSPLNKTTNLIFIMNKTFKKTPYSLKFKSYYNKVVRDNFSKNKQNELLFTNISSRLIFYSKFKSSILNFGLGIKLKTNHLSFKESNINFTEYHPFINLNGTFNKNIIWFIDFNYIKYNSESTQKDLFEFSPKLIYKAINKKWEFSLIGHDIFNINNTNLIKTNSYPSYYEEKIFKSLAGYVSFNVKYKF
ncbi:MAG: carboxypeptidase-like regulatory domain-containing protein [Flavobacteriaceae bacterium]|nr:carboxypeptidase-like regulatory domain-containing protein [Flavobacteriaceae bacterium]